MEHSDMYEQLKGKHEMNYITNATLKKWVEINEKKPGKGITQDEYGEITGEQYE